MELRLRVPGCLVGTGLFHVLQETRGSAGVSCAYMHSKYNMALRLYYLTTMRKHNTPYPSLVSVLF
jgi:hypothetical protein